MSKNNQTGRTRSLEGFNHSAIYVPRTEHSDRSTSALYNSTYNYYSEDEYLDLRIDFRFSLERGRR